MNTPRTDAIDTYQPFIVNSDKYKELANLARELESQNAEQIEALQYYAAIRGPLGEPARKALERK